MNQDIAQEVREQLKPYQNRRIEVEGTISHLGRCYDHRMRREVESVCFQNIEIREDEHPVIDHCWVTFAKLLVQAGVRVHDTVRFTAQVYDYKQRDPVDPNKFTVRLGLREPRDFRCLNRELTPEGGEREPVHAPDVDAEFEKFKEANGLAGPLVVCESVHPAPPAPPADPKRALLDALWRLVDEHGLDRVKKTLAAVETLTAE